VRTPHESAGKLQAVQGLMMQGANLLILKGW